MVLRALNARHPRGAAVHHLRGKALLIKSAESVPPTRRDVPSLAHRTDHHSSAPSRSPTDTTHRTFMLPRWPPQHHLVYRHAYKYPRMLIVLESLDYTALLRSQRSHPDHPWLNPPLGEPSRRLSSRSLPSSPSSCASGPPLQQTKTEFPALLQYEYPHINFNICFPH